MHAANPASHNVYRYSKIAGAAPTDPHWDEVLAADLLWPGPSGQPVTQTQFGWYWLDITTPEKQAAWVAILVETLNEYLAIGYDGIYFDNVGIIDPSLINEFPADYTDASYYADVGAVLAGMRAALPGVKFLINSYTGGQPAGLRGLEYLPYTDGMSFEAFSMKASTKFMDAGRWLQQLGDFAYVVAQGKLTIAMDYMQVGDLQRRMWSLASYLLVNSQHSYHRIAGTNVQADLQQYPEDQLDLGTSLGLPVARLDGLTEGLYSGGKIVANPNLTAKSYDLGAERGSRWC
ncbi:MAG: endo alpha-1,4 polygalactosaminidase [Deltaproteobacteria bacterium]|nr:endo alpha-1,4 polygalactosaminidase [Deltaproteobacteria bacterium]